MCRKKVQDCHLCPRSAQTTLWCSVPGNEVQHVGSDVFQRKWETATLSTVDDLQSLKIKMCLARSMGFAGNWALTNIEYAKGFGCGRNISYVNSIREIDESVCDRE
ncbi:uncharacterized protein LOC135385169 isoform X2 [Ornithodoros turicata]|uniref:uncharacterized protein LOC135385169 isoform X2 n=1 Tax=Ornithodoros turicata TaxID=34597 RepID=UPI003139573B